VFSLRGHRRNMSLVCGSLFLGRRPFVKAAVAAIEADAPNTAVHDRGVVDVVNHSDVHVGHRAVIEKVVVVPTSTHVTVTKITEPIVDPTIRTYLRTPVAVIENVSAVPPAPIAGGPKETNFRSQRPSSWHPIIVVYAQYPGVQM
jgi:hypothetical protein